MKNLAVLFLVASLMITSCKKEGCTNPTATNYNIEATKDDGSCVFETPETGPYLIVKIKFDSLQPRLDNFGNPATVPADHSTQSPTFYALSSHYIELAPDQWTALGDGEIIYKGIETTAGGSLAADFEKAVIKGNGEEYLKIPISAVTPGTYEWVRASIIYQNFDLKYKYQGIVSTGRLASFVGWNTYLTNYLIRNEYDTVNANKPQGYWAFEDFGIVVTGQAAGTTVVNPIQATSPIPAGSCVVTGDFTTPLVITGNETQDVQVTLSFSTNQSFEWYDANQDGLYEPDAGDYPVDMGLRGLEPVVE